LNSQPSSGALIVGWSNFSAKLDSTESRLTKLEIQNEITTDSLSTIKQDLAAIKASMEFLINNKAKVQ
jgi:hypothetical protein